MSSLAMSSFVEQQIVLHQFTTQHSAQARALLGWSQEFLAHQAGVPLEAVQQFESQRDVGDETRLAMAFRLEAEGLVFFPGFAPGWGMSVRRFDTAPSKPAAQGILTRLLSSTTDSPTPQTNGG